MEFLNNVKEIRKIYGTTQGDVAKALGVTRTTISQWENGISKPSQNYLEQLSLFFGIGPEVFYEEELTAERKILIKKTASQAQKIEEESGGTRNKVTDFKELFTEVPIEKLIRDYMVSTKVILASTNRIDIEMLETISNINKKMGSRLDSIIELKKAEQEKDGSEALDILLSSLDSFE